MKNSSRAKGKAPAPRTNGNIGLKSAGTNRLKSNGAPSTSVGKEEKNRMAAMSLDEFINSSGESEEAGSEEELDSEIDDEEMEGEGEDEETDNEEDEESGEEGDHDDDSGEEEDEDADSDEGEEDPDLAAKKHKKTLEKLKNSDPEFYQFLSENDRQLLDFETSDEDSEDEERGGEVHKLPNPDELEVGSDESDFEDEESSAKRQRNVITQAMVDNWQQELKDPKSIRTIVDVVSAFRSAVHSVTEEKQGATRFVVQGGAAFNAVVRLCIMDLIPAVKRFLKCSSEDQKLNLERCKSWVKVRTHVKSYLADVIRLLTSLTESSLLSVLLKHIHQLIPFYITFIKLARVLTKRLVTIWASADDTVRVLAFLSLLRLARTLPDQLLEPIIKVMYLSYARNCKFTSPSTWPVINFMRRSLVEVMALQESLTYKHAFLYIRQLAIHLRNAITLKKKDSVMTVYNWQYVHCLHLWAALLGALPDSQLMKPLIYPLVQIAIGTINLVPTGRYYPLRFHIVFILNQLSTDTRVYIPVLPFLLEIMQNHKFDKKPGKASMKPLDLSCILRVSQSQMAESGYRDAIVDLLYDRLLDSLTGQSHSAAFPETALPCILQLKQFIKTCPLAAYSKKMKQLMEKVQENVRFVEKHRAGVHFELGDTQAVMALENQIRAAGTPLANYHGTWKKMRDREMAIKIAKKPENDRDSSIPTMKRTIVKEDKKDGEEDGSSDDQGEFDELFPSDLSDDEDDEDRFMLKEERGKKRKGDDEDEDEQLVVKKKSAKQEEVAKKASAKKELEKKKKEKPKATVVEEEEDSDGQDDGDEVVDFNMSSEDEGSDDGENEEDEEGSEDEEASDDESYDQDDD